MSVRRRVAGPAIANVAALRPKLVAELQQGRLVICRRRRSDRCVNRILMVPVLVGLLMLGGGGETLVLAMVFFAVLTSVALTKVIKHYEARDERRKREEILLSR